jgi:acyl dehydratase
MLNSRRFNIVHQHAFARLSGDFNPLHVDPVYARRLLYGAPVVHGIHLVCWALDAALISAAGAISLSRLKVIFSKPVRVDDEVSLKIDKHADGRLKIRILARDVVATKIDVSWVAVQKTVSAAIDPALPQQQAPKDLAIDALENRHASLKLHLDLAAANQLFPQLVRVMLDEQLATLMASTRLVGNECPGLHSIYSELLLEQSTMAPGDALTYSVEQVDKRFGLVSIKLQAVTLSGEIKAFFRPSFQRQASFSDIGHHVSPNEFREQRAVVIGASRGLGEVVAKLLAAGGAEVAISYAQGRDDALKVVEDINTQSPKARVFELDVLNQPDMVTLQARLSGWRPTHLYYFATPFITPGTSEGFSGELLTRFCNYYVQGFFSTAHLMNSIGARAVFNPSTIFIEQIPEKLKEYAAAKAAGELAGNLLAQDAKFLTVYQPRLAKMSTDQTVNLMAMPSDDPLPIMLSHLRLFRDHVKSAECADRV